jgi:hypothetical protein
LTGLAGQESGISSSNSSASSLRAPAQGRDAAAEVIRRPIILERPEEPLVEGARCWPTEWSVSTGAANAGEKLVSMRFPNAMTKGFAGEGKPNVAVCLRPGTELAFNDTVEFEKSCIHTVRIVIPYERGSCDRRALRRMRVRVSLQMLRTVELLSTQSRLTHHDATAEKRGSH